MYKEDTVGVQYEPSIKKQEGQMHKAAKESLCYERMNKSKPLTKGKLS